MADIIFFFTCLNRDYFVLISLLAAFYLFWHVEAPKKKGKPSKSPYAKATDTGIDPERAAKRLDIDWDSTADIDAWYLPRDLLLGYRNIVTEWHKEALFVNKRSLDVVSF
jgi:hypothetical protein